ncbi:hypothetical protein M3612_19425 [Niallia taxi]|uniref:hypothetical protein n=1 Tax=Niallia taxi TaxID=2499688 RepID=UPI00203E64D9|nr:hypothetical protein [Niallia taxi]MCM3216663.1 hypothetical protein [Niallia taxi]
MLISRIIINLPRGLQAAKNTVEFLDIASSYNSEVKIICKNVICEMDIMEIMDLNIEKGKR